MARVFAANGHAWFWWRGAPIVLRRWRVRSPPPAGPRRLYFHAISNSRRRRQDRRGFDNAGVEVEYLVNNAGYGLFATRSNGTAPTTRYHRRQHRALTDLSLRFCRSTDPTSRRHPQCRSVAAFCRGRHGGILRLQGLCAVVQRRAAPELAPKASAYRDLPRPVPSEFQARAGFLPGVDSASSMNPPAMSPSRISRADGNKRAVLPASHQAGAFLLRLFPRGFVLRPSAACSCGNADQRPARLAWPVICFQIDMNPGEIRAT